MYKIVAMILCTLFFNISAMHDLNEQHYIHLALQRLVEAADTHNIIILPVKTNIRNTEARRKESEATLSHIALSGVRVCLHLIDAAKGKTFLVVDNKVDNYEENPSCSQGLLCKKINAEIDKKEVDLDSMSCHEASFIVYNMPYYRQNEGCFDWAYGEDLRDLLDQRKEPCLVLIDEDIYRKIDVADQINRRFYGKKKILKYDKKSVGLEEYRPSLLSEIPFPIMVGWAALVSIGLFYIMPSELLTSLNINF